MLAGERSAQEQAVGHFDVGRAARVHAVVATAGQFDVAGAIALGLLGEQLDRTTDGVLAGQRALRAPQHFDAIQVEQVENRTGQRGVIHVIDIDADARLEGQVEVGLTDAADERDHRRTEGCTVLRQRDVGGLGSNLRDVSLVAGFEHRGVDSRDGDRGLLQVLCAELRGDNHFLQRVVVGSGGLGQCLAGGHDGQRTEHGNAPA